MTGAKTRASRVLLAVFALAIGIGAPPARAVLDGDAIFLPSRITTDFDGGEDSVAAVAVQSDGRLLAAGTATVDGAGRFAVARYLPAGVLDPTFGVDGKATALVGRSSRANAAVLQRDGNIVVAGMAIGDSDIAGQFALARFLSDGRLDPSFGSAGTVITNFDGLPRTDIVQAIAIQPDGKVVVAGSTMTGGIGDSMFALARYLPDGRLDRTFDDDGLLTAEFGPGLDAAQAIAVQPDGKIIVTGRGTWCGPALVRYLPDGQPDPSFTPEAPERRTAGICDASSVALDRDGNIVIAGTAAGSVLELGVARYRPDGTPDPSFGRHGEVSTRIGRQAGASAITIQPNGKIIAAGVADVGTDRFRYAFAITRYRPDGSLDATFDGDGIAITDFSAYTDEAAAVTITPTGQIVAGGQAAFTSPERSDFAIAGLAPPLVDLPQGTGPGATGTRPGETAGIAVAQRPTSPSTTPTSRPPTTGQNPSAGPSRPRNAPGVAPPGHSPIAGHPRDVATGDSEATPPSTVGDAGADHTPTSAEETEASLHYTPAGNRRVPSQSRTALASIAALAAATVAIALAATRLGWLGGLRDGAGSSCGTAGRIAAP